MDTAPSSCVISCRSGSSNAVQGALILTRFGRDADSQRNPPSLNDWLEDFDDWTLVDPGDDYNDETMAAVLALSPEFQNFIEKSKIEPRKLSDMTETELRKLSDKLKKRSDAIHDVERPERGTVAVANFQPLFSLTTIPGGAPAVYSIEGPRTSEKLWAKIQRRLSSDNDEDYDDMPPLEEEEEDS